MKPANNPSSSHPRLQSSTGTDTRAAISRSLGLARWRLSDLLFILGVMERARVTRIDGSVLADCLFLIGQAWIKRAEGDAPGAAGDLAAAMRMVPPGTVEMILDLIEAGELPEPRVDDMDAWLERCREAGAGEFRMTVGVRRMPAAPAAAHVESEADFLARLSQIRADAERRHGRDSTPAAPVNLADELQATRLM